MRAILAAAAILGLASVTGAEAGHSSSYGHGRHLAYSHGHHGHAHVYRSHGYQQFHSYTHSYGYAPIYSYAPTYRYAPTYGHPSYGHSHGQRQVIIVKPATNPVAVVQEPKAAEALVAPVQVGSQGTTEEAATAAQVSAPIEPAPTPAPQQ